MSSSVGAYFALALLAVGSLHADEKPTKPLTAEQAREELAYSVGLQAYLYGYPLVEMDRVRQMHIFEPSKRGPAPLNQLQHARQLCDHHSTAVICPNNDTLYTSAFLDLSQEPLVLEVPDTNGRYYVAHLMDSSTNGFAYIGKRTTGTKAGQYAITGPTWKGTLPAQLKRIESPTNAVWLLARVLIDGPDDLAAVGELQNQFRLTTLSLWGKSEPPKPRTKAEVPAHDLTEPLKFFELLNHTLRENPPSIREAALMSLFSQIRVGPEQKFAVAELDAATARGLRRAIEAGQKILDATKLHEGDRVNGWTQPRPHLGKFGEDYLYRAYIARHLLAAMAPEEASIFTIGLDDRHRLNSERKYILRFESGQLPPVDGFWSVTMYHSPSGFLVENAKRRYSIGDRTKGVRHGSDGSLEILLQRDSPGAEMESNWLPAPKGNFGLALRCYVPKKAILDGTWKPPIVKAVP